jgi:hypothetical protein
VLRSNDQHASSVGNLTFKAHGLFGQVAFKVLIERRQIVDADETGVCQRLAWQGREPWVVMTPSDVYLVLFAETDDHCSAERL